MLLVRLAARARGGRFRQAQVRERMLAGRPRGRRAGRLVPPLAALGAAPDLLAGMIERTNRFAALGTRTNVCHGYESTPRSYRAPRSIRQASYRSFSRPCCAVRA